MRNGLAFRRARAFADHLLLVALWASVEQYSGRVLAVLASARGEVVRGADSWPGIVRAYDTLGHELSSLASFDDVDECRIVNNQVKHSGVVTGRLARLEAFAHAKGQPLASVELPLQRYSDAALEFVSHLIFVVDEGLATDSGRP